jgi:hypothetical protein
MDLDPPKHMMNWSGLVGDLFVKAAGIVDDQVREKSQPSEDWDPFKSAEQTSTALWSQKAWKAVMTIIWGQLSKSGDVVYTYGIPYLISLGVTEIRHGTFGVVVERCKSIVDVFCSTNEAAPVADCQQFINHPVRKKISLKTLAKVLSSIASLMLTNYRPFISFESKETSICRRIHSNCRRDSGH